MFLSFLFFLSLWYFKILGKKRFKFLTLKTIDNMKFVLALNGEWKIKGDRFDQGKDSGFWSPEFDCSSWDEVNIPCHWEVEVRRYYRKNPEIVWARKEFLFEDLKDITKIGSKLYYLYFKGIFYYVDVYLNGYYLGHHEGYFESFGFIVNSYLKSTNVLVIKVVCKKEKDLGRKKQMLGTFGHWDASDPHSNPGGIWNDIIIGESERILINSVRKTTELDSINLAKENVYISITADKNFNSLIKINYKPKNFDGVIISKEFNILLKAGYHEYYFNIEVHNPVLWWTHDYGSQNLYELEIECYSNETEFKNILLDTYNLTTGIKEIHLERSGKNGNEWTITFNKHSFFMKGTNYPPWLRLATATKNDFIKDLTLFKKANMNCLRVHAHLSRQEFYEACDEEGLVLWQDLPLQWVYSKKIFPEIKRQAEIAIKTYQSHPSIAIWCAHNEPFYAPDKKLIKFSSLFFLLSIFFSVWSTFSFYNFLVPILSSSIICGLFSFILGSIIFTLLLWMVGKYFDLYPFGLFFNSNSVELDPDLYLLIKKIENGQNIVLPYSGICELPFTIFRSPRLNKKIYDFKKFYTDFHYYAGWYNGNHKKDYRYHIKWWGLNGKLRDRARFVTEYGAQAFPKFESFKKFYPKPLSWPPPQDWWIPLEKNHCFQKKVQKKCIKFNQCKSFEEFIETSQEWQAECLKATTEMFRQIKYRPLAGLITFLGIDCFPSITWSIIDFYRIPKKGYYIIKDIFEPIYAMVDWPKKVYKIGDIYQSFIYISNDYWQKVDNINLKWKLLTPKNIIIKERNHLCSLEPDSIKEIGHLSFSIPDEEFVKLQLIWNDPIKTKNVQVNEYRFNIGRSRWEKHF